MSTTKHYDQILQKWVIDGASNAKDIELSNPGFLNEAGESVSVDNAFTKLDNRMSKLEQNVAWIYLNGAKGGGGGTGGGGGSAEYTIELSKTTIYTTTSSATIPFLIKSGGVPKAFTVIVTDKTNNKVLATVKRNSMQQVEITVNDLQGNVTLELSAYDNQNYYAVPVYVQIVAGAISLSLNGTFPVQIVQGSASSYNANFKYTNNSGSPAVFKVQCGEFTEVQTTPYQSGTLSQSLANFIKKYYPNAVPGVSRFTFTFTLSTTLDGDTMTTEPITRTTSLVYGDRLTLLTFDITDNAPTKESDIPELTTYSQGSAISFTYRLSYNVTGGYTQFDYFYNVYKVKLGQEPQLIDGPYSAYGIKPAQDFTFVCPTTGYEESEDQEYLMIEITAYASDDPANEKARDTKRVYCKLAEADNSILREVNQNGQLLAAFNKFNFPNNTTGTWKYDFTNKGVYSYNGNYGTDQFPNGIDLIAYKTNGVSTGFIADTTGDQKNGIPGMVLSSGSYAEIPAFKTLFPSLSFDETVIGTNYGFCFSTTFKTDTTLANKECVISYGRYEYTANGYTLQSGYEVTPQLAKVKIGSAAEITVDLPKNELVTLDLNIKQVRMKVSATETRNAYYFILYLNGVMSACKRIEMTGIDWMFGQSLYLGGRCIDGFIDNSSNVTFYDIKLYTQELQDVNIIQNWMSATEQASLVGGKVDDTLDINLKKANLFNGTECLLWDYANGKYKESDVLLSSLITALTQGEIEYPIVVINETAATSNFQRYSTATWTEGDGVQKETFPCTIQYYNQLTGGSNPCIISTPDGVSAENGPRIGLQGTSSLTYNAKNFELYMGKMNEQGDDRLFNPTDDWLPENEFTLKADVVDSGHVNNVVIGQIINGKAGQIMEATPPMMESDSVWTSQGVSEERAKYIKSRIRHTSDGFPVLLFIKFAGESSSTTTTQFMGIYNFNLGRKAYYNLGLKLLIDYTKADDRTGFPSDIIEYKEDVTHWNGRENTGVYSMEIAHHDSAEGAFQQDDMNTIKYMYDNEARYTSTTDAQAFTKLQQLYTQLANMALEDTPIKTRTTSDGTGVYETTGRYYTRDLKYYQYPELQKYLNINNCCYYYMIAIIFGMVDSLCKNMTLRSWGGDVWYNCFYDMDTAFKLNNAGSQVVDYYAHLNRYYNVISNGLTTTAVKQFDTGYDGDTFVQFQHYASVWSRMWEVLQNIETIDPGNVEANMTLSKAYKILRGTIFADPKKFIKEYYQSYVDKCGPIVYNYDYTLKYINMSKKWDESIRDYVDDTSADQGTFLYGTRAQAVADWFEKRIYFLDGVYGIPSGTTIESPLNDLWNDNKTNNTDNSVYKSATLSASSKVMFEYTVGNLGTYNFWLDEIPTQVQMRAPGGAQLVITIKGNKYITTYENFKELNWLLLSSIDFPLLEDLDLSGCTLEKLFESGVFDATNNKGLKNIRRLNLSNVRLKSETGEIVSRTLDVSSCSRLEYLDVSNSSFTSFSLPSSGSLHTYDLSGTKITSLGIPPVNGQAGQPWGNQPFLESINLNGCYSLTSIYITNCESLKTITVPSSVQRVYITNCPSFESLRIPYNGGNVRSNLVEVHIETCPGLKTVNLASQNNPDLVVNLIGATGLEELNLSSASVAELILPSVTGGNFTSLKSINLARTLIKSFNYNGYDPGYLDLTYFQDLEDLNLQYNTTVTKVACCNNQSNPIELGSNALQGCTSLSSLTGNFVLTGTRIFSECSNLNFTLPQLAYTSFDEGPNAMNIQIDPELKSMYYMFESCTRFNGDNFKYIMSKLTPTITSLEGTFSGCISMYVDTWRDMFKNCPNVSTLKSAFQNSALTGILYSRTAQYSPNNEGTYGIFDFIPNVTNLEQAFYGTSILKIDNNVFVPIIESLQTIDQCFAECRRLQVWTDCSENGVGTEGMLNSQHFFTDLISLTNTLGYPKNVFTGCIGVKMEVINQNGNTYLFHTSRTNYNNNAYTMVLDGSLYSGIQLVGEIGDNVFGSRTRNLGGNYTIPKFSAIRNPFSNSKDLTIKLSEMQNLFTGMSSYIAELYRVFAGVTCEPGYNRIPENIFRGLTQVNSMECLFEGFELTNEGDIYKFPSPELFKDCTSLENIKGFFSGQAHLKIELLGEGFKNCKLTAVDSLFKGSGVFGIIPYRLFYMEKDGQVRRTIKSMENMFQDCVCLGFSSDREIDEKIPISQNLNGDFTYADRKWGVPVEGKEGTPVFYSVDKGDYSDFWRLDGTPWDEATAKSNGVSDTDWDKLYEDYFQYDEAQELALSINNIYDSYQQIGYQNYILPTDIFRYCSSACTLENSLNGINRIEYTKTPVPGYNQIYSIVPTNRVIGLKGRIPCRIFEALVDNTKLLGVFRNVYHCAYINMYKKGNEAAVPGIKYPYDLFKYNAELQSVERMFYGSDIEVGVNINTDLFINNPKLYDITGLWEMTTFDARTDIRDGAPQTEQQIPIEYFSGETLLNIRKAGNLFAGNQDTTGKIYGPRLMSSTFLQRCILLEDISGMFSFNLALVGEVPNLDPVSYTNITSYQGYLRGIPKGNISNANSLSALLIPDDWKENG